MFVNLIQNCHTARFWSEFLKSFPYLETPNDIKSQFFFHYYFFQHRRKSKLFSDRMHIDDETYFFCITLYWKSVRHTFKVCKRNIFHLHNGYYSLNNLITRTFYIVWCLRISISEFKNSDQNLVERPYILI